MWPALPRAALCMLTLAAWVAWAACCRAAHPRRDRSRAHRRDPGPSRRVRGRPSRHPHRRRRSGPEQRRNFPGRNPSCQWFRALGGDGPIGASSRETSTEYSYGAAPALGTEPACETGSGGSRRRRAPSGRWSRRPTRSASPRLCGESPTLRLDDGSDWMTLAALNLGRDMGPAVRFIDPDHLRVGWTLLLPSDTAAQGSRPALADPESHLPELVTLGLGSLACAALARRANRRRRLRPFVEDERTAAVLSDSAVDTARHAASLRRGSSAGSIRVSQPPAGLDPRRQDDTTCHPGGQRGPRRCVVLAVRARSRCPRSLRGDRRRPGLARRPRRAGPPHAFGGGSRSCGTSGLPRRGRRRRHLAGHRGAGRRPPGARGVRARALARRTGNP